MSGERGGHVHPPICLEDKEGRVATERRLGASGLLFVLSFVTTLSLQ